MGKEVPKPGLASYHCYQTPLHALGDGWRLMSPPVLIPDYALGKPAYQWWFEKWE